MENMQTIAERLYNLVPWWDRNGETVEDVAQQLAENPIDVVTWLLDYIDELEN